VWGFGWYAPSERPSEEVDRQLVCYERELNTKWDPRENELPQNLPFIAALVEQALLTLPKETRRPGAEFSIVLEKEAPFLYLQSVEGIYVLMLEFETAFEPEHVSAAVAQVLPQIKALTLALPPPNGPSTTEGAARRFYLEDDVNRFDLEEQIIWRERKVKSN